MTAPNYAAAGIKPRYELLDGLRGVAAFAVIWYHFFEGFATSPTDQWMNHGYLAVDFFYVLSGFVIGYAYDDRWRDGGMTAGRFMLRRVIRLQPMVVLSVVLGLVAFLVQGSVRWDGSAVPVGMVLLSLLMGLFLIPVFPGMGADVRGNGEMFPLNGPSWSLFFEYIGSILYAVVLHRLSRKSLACVTAVSGAGLAIMAVGDFSGAYHLGMGWSMGGWGFLGGFLRLSFSFSVGLLMARGFRPVHVRGAFWICGALILAVLACPYIGVGDGPSVFNGIYDTFCTLAVFPAIVYMGASGATTDIMSTRICGFLGRLSYPVYIIHYPVMYLFYAWVWNNRLSFARVWPVCVALLVLITAMAWAALRFYDEPVRNALSHRWLGR